MPINRVLTDTDRLAYTAAMRTMQKYWPEMYARKIPDSMVQFAYCYQTVLDLDRTIDDPSIEDRSILSAGSYEDIATECLKLDGFCVVGVDPVLNCDIHTFRLRTLRQFQYIVSASVLEHVKNDEEFLTDCCSLLRPRGYGIFTVDFNNDWSSGRRIPTTSHRFYTAKDLTQRLPAILRQHSCKLIDSQNYEACDRFIWEGITYSFATFVFRKS